MALHKLFARALIALATTAAFSSTEATAQTRSAPKRSSGAPPKELGQTRARPLGGSATSLITSAVQRTQSATTIDDYAQVMSLCQQTLEAGPDAATKEYANQLLAWAANRRGEAYSQEAAKRNAAGETQKALHYDKAALLDFDTAVVHDPTKWKSLHNRGVSLALIARYEEALEDLTKALELKSDYTNTWFNRAEVRYELGQYEDAVSDYSEVIQRQPDDAGAFTGRGHAHFRMGEFDKALADHHRAVTLDKQSPGALVNRGDTYRQLGQWEKAAADYRNAVKIDNTYGRAYRSAAWLMATAPNDKLRNAELALQAAQKAIDLDGAEDYLYLDTLAAAHANAGDYSSAVQSVEQALDIAPEEAQLPLQERLTHYQSGKPYRLSGTQTATQLTPAKR